MRAKRCAPRWKRPSCPRATTRAAPPSSTTCCATRAPHGTPRVPCRAPAKRRSSSATRRPSPACRRRRTPSPNGLAPLRPMPCATSCDWCNHWKFHWLMAPAPMRKHGASAGAPCRRSTRNTNAACSSALPPPRPRWARAAPPTCGNCRPTRSACLMKCCAWKSSPASTAAPNLPAIA
ncbi:hypothetical protein D3C81_1770370 [compost metagenome]